MLIIIDNLPAISVIVFQSKNNHWAILLTKNPNKISYGATLILNITTKEKIKKHL